jgi:hypothetical protein
MRKLIREIPGNVTIVRVSRQTFSITFLPGPKKKRTIFIF